MPVYVWCMPEEQVSIKEKMWYSSEVFLAFEDSSLVPKRQQWETTALHEIAINKQLKRCIEENDLEGLANNFWHEFAEEVGGRGWIISWTWTTDINSGNGGLGNYFGQITGYNIPYRS